jgi:MFS family permease
VAPTRDLRLLAGATFLSSAGDLLALIVLALQVHELTGSGLAVSALFATTLVPAVAVAPLAGLVADRFESVRVLVAASLAQAGVAAALAFSTDLAVILALASVLTVGNAFAQSGRVHARARGRGGRARDRGDRRPRGRALRGLCGRAAAGRGADRPGAAAGAADQRRELPRHRGGGRRDAGPPPAQPEHRDRARPSARRLAAATQRQVSCASRSARRVGTLLFISAALTVEIFYLKDVVGASDSSYALLVCVWMAGMVCGATALARRVPSPLTAAGALIALAVQGAGMGIQTTWAILPVAFSGYLLGGLGHGVKNVLLRTLLTARVPDRLHGRAFAAYNAARNTAELAAIGAGGLLVNALGPRGALVIAGLGPLVAAAAGLTGLRGRRPGLATLRGPRPAGRLSPLTTRLAVRPDEDLTP